jgi:hypothetical protein
LLHDLFLGKSSNWGGMSGIPECIQITVYNNENIE